MRVANRTVYNGVKFNISNITEELHKANETVAVDRLSSSARLLSVTRLEGESCLLRIQTAWFRFQATGRRHVIKPI